MNKTTKIILLAVLGIILVGGTAYGEYRLLKNSCSTTQPSDNQATQSGSQQATESANPDNGFKPASVEYIWDAYHNSEFGFSFEYPKGDKNNPTMTGKVKDEGLGLGNLYGIYVQSDYFQNDYTNIMISIAKEGVTNKERPDMMRTLTENSCHDFSKDTNAIIGGERGYLVETNSITVSDPETRKMEKQARRFCACFPHGDLFFEISYQQNAYFDDSQYLGYKRLLETFTFDNLSHSASLPDLNSL